MSEYLLVSRYLLAPCGLYSHAIINYFEEVENDAEVLHTACEGGVLQLRKHNCKCVGYKQKSNLSHTKERYSLI